MNSVNIALIVFTVIFGAAVLGLLVKSILPEAHLSPESREVVKLSIGLIATMTALVLGLLVGSVKSSFDSKNDGYNKICANLVLLDRLLAQYGPEAAAPRGVLKAAVTARSQEVIERKGVPRVTKADAYKTMVGLEKIQAMIRALQPPNDAQKDIRDRALGVSSDIVAARWQLLGGVASAVPIPFLVVVIIWLAVIFLSFGIFAPRNATTVTSLCLAAISVAGALFLILEMDQPFDGIIHLSDRPLQNAAQYIGQ
ncbi:hypothetical protein AYO41_04780 [Verrucomicrobia bacterium SCGC AG-212-E04]|nr:hypothetical protein AYO41_04780 [Verrucomicrobia bacterium SCGC AG-212-E04]